MRGSLVLFFRRCAEHVEACETSVEAGYTDGYVPVAGESLAEPYDAALIAGLDTNYIGTESTIDCSLYIGESDSSNILHGKQLL